MVRVVKNTLEGREKEVENIFLLMYLGSSATRRFGIQVTYSKETLVEV